MVNPMSYRQLSCTMTLWAFAVAFDVYDGVFFVLSILLRGVLDEILNLIDSVSEGFHTYCFKSLRKI